MSDKNIEQNEELAFLDFIAKLRSCWLLLAFCILSGGVGGLVYSLSTHSKYKVTIPYVIKVYPVSSLQLCQASSQRSKSCLEDDTMRIAMGMLDNGWSYMSGQLRLVTMKQHSQEEYLSIIKQLNVMMVNMLKEEAEAELKTISSLLDSSKINANQLASNALNAKRNLYLLNNANQVFKFGQTDVEQISPKVAYVIILSACMGGILGVLIILMQDIIQQSRWREREKSNN